MSTGDWDRQMIDLDFVSRKRALIRRALAP